MPADSLHEIFSSHRWRRYIRDLSSTTGFILSLYGERGDIIFSTADPHPACSALHMSPSFRLRCEGQCAEAVFDALESDAPRVFKCLSRVMCFALPIKYLSNRAALLGQGSFGSYDDLRDFTRLLCTLKIEAFPMSAPVSFTPEAVTRSVMELVNGSVNEFLKSCLENTALARRFSAIYDITKTIVAIQNSAALLQAILDKSAELLRAEQGSLMLLDERSDALLMEAKKGMIEGDTEKIRIQRGEGIAGLVAELGEPLLVTNVESDPRIKKKNRQRYKTPSFVSVPLKIENRIMGVLNLSDKAGGGVFNEDDLKVIQTFADHAAIMLERNALYAQTEELKKLSITDPLTGLLNRRYLLDRLEEELSRSKRHNRHVSLLMLDLDGFKSYNDTFGHLAGDRALKIFSDTILSSVRSMDIVSRYGGDEFLIILPETDMPEALVIAERLRTDILDVALPADSHMPKDLISPITASIGIACYPEHGTVVELLIERADRALYRAKEKGKNRVEVFL